METTVYFKSTDGHYGKWDFNLRRGNWHVLKQIANHKGCVIVDSTRNGKRIPDALSKTIPLWCAVLNEMLELDLNQDERKLRVLPSAVSANESSQMMARIPSFVQRLRVLIHLNTLRLS